LTGFALGLVEVERLIGPGDVVFGHDAVGVGGLKLRVGCVDALVELFFVIVNVRAERLAFVACERLGQEAVEGLRRGQKGARDVGVKPRVLLGRPMHFDQVGL